LGIYPIFISCRDFVFVKFFFKKEQDANEIYSNLQRLMNVGKFSYWGGGMNVGDVELIFHLVYYINKISNVKTKEDSLNQKLN